MRKINRIVLVVGVLLLLGCVAETSNNVVDQEAYAQEALDAKETTIPKDIQALGEKVVITRVIDGDTVEVTGKNGDETVRLAMIDTPETVHPNKPEQQFGREASDFAKAYLAKGATVIFERGYTQKDKYHRSLGYVWVGRVNFNELLLKLGYARMAFVDENEPYVAEFEAAQQFAKQHGLHIWSIDDYVTKRGFSMTSVKNVMYRINR